MVHKVDRLITFVLCFYRAIFVAAIAHNIIAYTIAEHNRDEYNAV